MVEIEIIIKAGSQTTDAVDRTIAWEYTDNDNNVHGSYWGECGRTYTLPSEARVKKSALAGVSRVRGKNMRMSDIHFIETKTNRD